MTEDDRGGEPSQPARPRPAPDKNVTPDSEPSALERGARIFERLARRSGRSPR
jgi:hypothetical protein